MVGYLAPPHLRHRPHHPYLPHQIPPPHLELPPPLAQGQDPLSNDHPITVPIPLISNNSASDRKKSEQDLLMIWVLNGATPSVQDRHVSKGGNIEHPPKK